MRETTGANSRRPLRIANISGFLGDRRDAALELLAEPDLDVLSGDWLAELSMVILRKLRERDPSGGFPAQFLRQIEPVLGTCLDRGIRIVSNAGGLNPLGCARALDEMASALGLPATVGSVHGDDILDRMPSLLAAGEITAFPKGAAVAVDAEDAIVANAYLGAWGIVDLLRRGADVVVTGRVSDASLIVGPAAWWHEWDRTDWSRIAGAVTAGHVIECGTQACGGNFAFFDEVPGMDRIAFPIAEIAEDGSAVITKAQGGGCVTVETVTAQLVYEIQGPRYLSPDATVDLESIRLTQEGPDRVRISEVVGEAPPEDLKVSMAVKGGYRNSMMIGITGLDAERKRDVAERAVWSAIPGGKDAFDRVNVELLGRPVEDPKAFDEAYSFLRIAVLGRDRKTVGRGFSSAVVETALASIPGFFLTSPPQDATEVALFRPVLVRAACVDAIATLGEESFTIASAVPNRTAGEPVRAQVDAENDALPPGGDDVVRLPLGTVAGARSGDKGGDANIGLWTWTPHAHAWLQSAITPDLIRQLIPRAGDLEIEIHRLPNLKAVNIVIHGLLEDGASSGLSVDNQAKALGEYLRSRLVDIPRSVVEQARRNVT